MGIIKAGNDGLTVKIDDEITRLRLDIQTDNGAVIDATGGRKMIPLEVEFPVDQG